MLGLFGISGGSCYDATFMTARPLTVETLVVEPGGVAAVLHRPVGGDDVTVRTASRAMARAQDVIRNLRATIVRSRALRERAQHLQDEADRLRCEPFTSRDGGRRWTTGRG
jgi:hypothetical protein